MELVYILIRWIYYLVPIYTSTACIYPSAQYFVCIPARHHIGIFSFQIPKLKFCDGIGLYPDSLDLLPGTHLYFNCLYIPVCAIFCLYSRSGITSAYLVFKFLNKYPAEFPPQTKLNQKQNKISRAVKK